MTDNEIIKALEFCSNEKCAGEKCPLHERTVCTKECLTMISGYSLDLIQRQQERIIHLETLLDDRCDKCIEREREDAVHSYREALVDKLEKEKSDWNDDYNVPINRAIAIVKGETDDR